MLAALVPDAVPLIPATLGAVQLYTVPVGTISVPLVGLTVNVPLLHMVESLLAMLGVGFTTTVTVWGYAGQPVELVMYA